MQVVNNIQETDEELVLLSNGGEICDKFKATVPKLGEVWYNPKAITNIFSFVDMENLYKITYDTSAEKAFVVHLPNKQVCFTRDDNILYILKPNKGNNGKISAQVCAATIGIDSVQENKLTIKLLRLKLLDNYILYHSLGTPLVRDFNHEYY